MTLIGLNSNDRPDPNRGFSSPEDGLIYFEPFDFGHDRGPVLRALELNRQLLYEAGPEVRYDPEAVQKKIDDLLGRLSEADYCPGDLD